LKPGDSVVIEHTGRAMNGRRQSAVVKHVGEGSFAGRRLPRIGLLFVRERRAMSSRDQRTTERFACAETFPIHATALSPLFCRDWLHFKVKELGAGGATLATSLRNKGLLVGMELAFNVSLAMSGSYETRGRITSVYRDGRDNEFRVGIEWIAP